jgi:hypothetical protein
MMSGVILTDSSTYPISVKSKELVEGQCSLPIIRAKFNLIVTSLDEVSCMWIYSMQGPFRSLSRVRYKLLGHDSILSSERLPSWHMITLLRVERSENSFDVQYGLTTLENIHISIWNEIRLEQSGEVSGISLGHDCNNRTRLSIKIIRIWHVLVTSLRWFFSINRNNMYSSKRIGFKTGITY